VKKNILIAFLTVLTIVNVAALTTIAYNRITIKRHSPRRENAESPDDFMRRELGLDDSQAKAFKEGFEKFKLESDSIMDSLDIKRAALIDELAAENPNAIKLDSLATEIDAMQAEMQKKMIAHLLASKSVLTIEQQKKFFSAFKKRKDREGGPDRPGNLNEHRGKNEFRIR